MSEDAETKRQKTVIYILDRMYTVSSSGDPNYIKHLAERVDEQMRFIKTHVGDSSSTKLAVLTALNFADEIVKLQEEVRKIRENLDQANLALDQMLQVLFEDELAD